MGVPLRALIVDDSDEDARLMVRALQRGGYEVTWERVDTAEALTAALPGDPAWDVVLAEYAMPRFTGLAALHLVRARGLDLPFIVVSATSGEDAALAAMHAGAHDFVAKHHLERLAATVARRLRAAAERQQRHHAEAALRRSVAITHAIVNTAVDGFLTVNERGLIESFNPAAERLFGYTADEVIGQNVSLLMPPPDSARHDEYIARYLRTGEPHIIGTGREVQARRKDGSTFPIDLAVSEIVLGDSRLFAGVLRDITARKRAETRFALQYATTRVLAASPSFDDAGPRLLQAIGEAIGWDLGELWQVDGAQNVLRWNVGWQRAGLDATTFVESSRHILFGPGVGLAGRVWADGQPAWLRDVSSSGSLTRSAAATALGFRAAFAFPLRTDSAVLGVVVFFSQEQRDPDPEWVEALDALGRQIGDFIERKRAEAALRDSEQLFSQFMRHLPGVAFIKDVEGRYLYVNDALEEIFHRTLTEYVGRTDEEVWPASVAEELRSNDRRVIETRTMLQTTETLPQDDGLHHWLVTKFPILNSNGQPMMVAGVAVDVTDRRRAEAELREWQKVAQQRERLADIGAITAQIVHDLGNPLAGVSMQAQLILRRASRDASQPVSTVVKAVERILAEVRRLDSLTKEFMEFSREQRLALKAVDLRRFLQRVVDLWQPVAAARSIAIGFETPPELPSLVADEEKLHRVFDNLVKNAIEAIDQGPGRVGIQVSRNPPEGVRISVSDTGPGIPESVQVFRLFETTKPEGSGVGLAVARQIVLAHRGSIDCTRLTPRGTVFTVDLPCGEPVH